VIIREASPEDVPALSRIVERAYEVHIEAVGHRPGPMDDDYAEKVSLGETFVADEDGAVVGILVLRTEPDHLLVENVAIDPGSQGHGLGRALLAFAETYATDRDLPELRLYTNVAMTDNIALYRRLGYEEVGRRSDHGFRRVFMTKRLARGSSRGCP
jgi:ribosomal protein S18 acetylase RimI-like enzyme